MKRFKVFSVATVLAIGYLQQPVSLFATYDDVKSEYSSTFSSSTFRQSEIEQLRADLDYIRNIEFDDLQEFFKENREWVEAVDNKLAEFLKIDHLHTLSSHNGYAELVKRLGLLYNADFSIESYGVERNVLDLFFHWTRYQLRGGLMTNSMDPRANVRVLRTEARAAWTVLRNNYPNIRNNGHENSLYNQYWCHFEFGTFTRNWDIEEGRSDVSMNEVILARCNP